jgi:hypothetical protein
MDVDWARTERGIREFDPLVVRDFRAKGITHVRIRVADEPTEARLIHLRKLVEACEQYGVIPIIAYQADEYKNDPKADNEKETINWWIAVAHYFGQSYPLLGFDLIYEPADKLNHNLASLNRVYEKTIKAIHDIDPQRMIFIAPRLRAAPEDLSSLKLPAHSQNYLLAEWHIFPWGPLKNSGKYPWTSGTAAEKAAIHNRINTALHWQQKPGTLAGSGAGAWENQAALRQPPRKWRSPPLWPASCKRRKSRMRLTRISSFTTGKRAWRPAPEPLLQAMIAPSVKSPARSRAIMRLNRLLVMRDTRRQRQPAQ